MTDSTTEPMTAASDQWPRWEVFKQDSAGRPHQAVGSVHAGDPAHALLTARNVFARRPAAVSLWAVRERDILSATAGQPQDGAMRAADLEPVQPYHVGIKASHKRSMTFVDLVGTVQSGRPADALAQARALYPQALAWWVFPDLAVVRSDEDQDTLDSWFAPAREKTYKQQQFYGTIGRHIGELKREGKIPGVDPAASRPRPTAPERRTEQEPS